MEQPEITTVTTDDGRVKYVTIRHWPQTYTHESFGISPSSVGDILVNLTLPTDSLSTRMNKAGALALARELIKAVAELPDPDDP